MHNYMVVHCDAIPQESSQSVNLSRWCGCFCWWLMQMAAASLASLTVFLRCFLCDIGPEDTMTYVYSLYIYTKLKLGFVNLCFGCGHLSKICFTRDSPNTTTTWPLFFSFLDRQIDRSRGDRGNQRLTVRRRKSQKISVCSSTCHAQGIALLMSIDPFFCHTFESKDFPMTCLQGQFVFFVFLIVLNLLNWRAMKKHRGLMMWTEQKRTLACQHMSTKWQGVLPAIDHPKKGFQWCFFNCIRC